jgi:hypothetical protein
MASYLVPCEGCTRHLRAIETACPFCGLARESDHAGPSAALGGRALTRAALVFAAAAATTSCGPESNGPVAVYGPAPVQVEAGTTVTVTPPPSDTGKPTPPPTPSDTGKPTPPPTATDAGANAPPPEPPPPPAPERDAGGSVMKPPPKKPETPHPGPVPMYGVPPMHR